MIALSLTMSLLLWVGTMFSHLIGISITSKPIVLSRVGSGLSPVRQAVSKMVYVRVGTSLSF